MAEREITKEEWAAFEKVYRTKWRQLYRWAARGVANGEPCPLADPCQMPLWWARNMQHACPAKILQAARDAGAPGADLAAATEKNRPPIAPIDLTQFDLDEGQAVTFQRRLVASLQNRITAALKLGESTDLLQLQHAKAARTLREMERDDREDRVHRDKYLPRDLVEREAAQAAQMLRQMHSSMGRMVIERCPGLAPRHRGIVTTALEHVFRAQAEIFQRLHTFASTDDLLADLAAA
jgi:hypothetical protein